MSQTWSIAELRYTPISEVRRQAFIEVFNDRLWRSLKQQMAPPLATAFAVIAAFFLESYGMHWDTLIVGVVGPLLTYAGVALKSLYDGRKENLKFKSVEQSRENRKSEAMAELDFEERKRVDAKQEQFIEMIREMHLQQTADMKSIITSQQSLIESQRLEMSRQAIQISDMQKELLRPSA